MHWIYLFAAILLEVTGTTCMKLSEGFSKPGWAVAMGCFYLLCFTSLTLAVRTIDLGLAYAIWAGLGTALVAAIGVFVFKETLTVFQIVCIVMIVVGVAGLNLKTGH